MENENENLNNKSSADLLTLKPRKLTLKVKLQKPSEQQDQDQEPPPPQPQVEVKRHICEVCNKEFSSGKAYGGHVRIHLQERRKSLTKPKKRSFKRVRSVDGESSKSRSSAKYIKAGDLMFRDGKIVCCLCGKDFKSMPSLFGHMRNHPDRGWKGIRPPDDKDNYTHRSSSSSDSAQSRSDTKTRSCLSVRWGCTGIRGRGTVDHDLKAAYSLMMMSNSIDLGFPKAEVSKKDDILCENEKPNPDTDQVKIWPEIDLNEPYIM